MSQARTPIIGTGLTGLVGSRIVSLLSDKYTFTNLDITHPTHPVDITDEKSVELALAATDAKYLLHCAAYTDVTGAWNQSNDKTGSCYRVNVLGTEHLAKSCARHGIHLLFLSTAYVFNGETSSPYVESDQPHPIEWYGQTKLLAEEVVRAQATAGWTVLRIDQPFRPDSFAKLDTAHRVLSQLLAGTLPPPFADHTFGPTYIDDLANVLDWCIQSSPQGIYHATSGEAWTDFTFAQEIAHHLSYTGKILEGSLEAYLLKATRPYQKFTALNTAKLQQESGQSFTSISQALKKTVVTYLKSAT